MDLFDLSSCRANEFARASVQALIEIHKVDNGGENTVTRELQPNYCRMGVGISGPAVTSLSKILS
jgi:hypothetical protein